MYYTYSANCIAESKKYSYLNEYENISKKFKEFKKKRDKILRNCNLNDETKDFYKSYVSLNNDSSGMYIDEPQKIVENRLNNLQLDKDRIQKLLKFRNQLLEMELKFISEQNIESSYIFEKSFFNDIQKDIKLSKINNDFNLKQTNEQINIIYKKSDENHFRKFELITN